LFFQASVPLGFFREVRPVLFPTLSFPRPFFPPLLSETPVASWNPLIHPFFFPPPTLSPHITCETDYSLCWDLPFLTTPRYTPILIRPSFRMRRPPFFLGPFCYTFPSLEFEFRARCILASLFRMICLHISLSLPNETFGPLVDLIPPRFPEGLRLDSPLLLIFSELFSRISLHGLRPCFIFLFDFPSLSRQLQIPPLLLSPLLPWYPRLTVVPVVTFSFSYFYKLDAWLRPAACFC